MVTVKELQKQLPDFRVLAVNGEAAALLSDHGEPYFCSAKMENGEVIVGSKVALNKVNFVCDDATIEVDAAKIVSVQNARCEKERLVVKGATHAAAGYLYPEIYWKAITDFINKYI